jgi:hypothetical protein
MMIEPQTKPEELTDSGVHWWSDDEFVIAWKGCVFVHDRKAGADSVAAIAAALTQAPLAEVARSINGVYGIFVYARRRQEWSISVDSAGLYRVFYDRPGISTSFLDLLDARQIDADGLDPAAIIEFLTYGAWFGTHTPAAGVRRLGHDQVLVMRPDEGLAVREKVLDAPRTDGVDRVLSYCDDFVHSLDGERISVDATGGYDSRVLVSLLSERGVDFEAAVSGHGNGIDIQIGRKIAETLGKPFFASQHDLGDLEVALAALFRAGDGMTDLRRFHRDYQNALARQARGVEMIVHGGGGELFKDQYSYQDFPFYGLIRPNMKKYYALRVAPIGLPQAQLTPSSLTLSDQLRTEALRKMQDLTVESNTESYNRIWYFLRAPDHFGQFYSNYINMGMDVVAPFLDYRNAHVGMRLPPWQTVFTRWHRSIITRACPAIAAIPTSDGYTASNAPRHLLGNLIGFAGTQLRRGAKKLSQKTLGRALFHKAGAWAADAPGFLDQLRASRHFRQALDRLKLAGILAPAVQPSEIRDIHVGRVLAMGMLMVHLDAASQQRVQVESPAEPVHA